MCSDAQIVICHGENALHGPGGLTGPYIAFMFITAYAPLLFFVYLQNGMVCAPRAIAASSVFGAAPLVLLTVAAVKRQRGFYVAALAVLAVEVIITPLIMLGRLGWEKLISERLPAFFTFEAVALVQTALVVLLLRDMRRGGE